MLSVPERMGEKSAFEEHEKVKTELFSPKLQREAAVTHTLCLVAPRMVTKAQREAAGFCSWRHRALRF